MREGRLANAVSHLPNNQIDRTDQGIYRAAISGIKADGGSIVVRIHERGSFLEVITR